ncbi:MAG: nitroreductase family protein [Alistipes senegalensis]|nr:nitroreductase family protein [Oxalobacter formigenes]MCM1281059.1 nitroreductase family protein [Alistipes senegalensis]
MSFNDLAAKRYSVRKFSTQEVEKEKLEYVLRAGQLAPTAVNFQPQRILVITDRQARARLRECTSYHFNAPVSFLVCSEKEEAWVRPYDKKNSGEIDCSIVTTQMMLAAADIGLGTTWVMYFDPERIREAFSIPPSLEPVALLVMGYPAEDAVPSPKHLQRKPLEETVFYNSFSA